MARYTKDNSEDKEHVDIIITKDQDEVPLPIKEFTRPYAIEDKSVADPGKMDGDYQLGFFNTPDVTFNFYLNSYLIWGIILSIFVPLPIIFRILIFLYILLSNYTYAWYCDYKRYKKTGIGWLITPFGAKKSKNANDLFIYDSTETEKTNIWSSEKSFNYSAFFVLLIVVGYVKAICVIPFAFVSLFTHRSRINTYRNEVVADHIVDQIN